MIDFSTVTDGKAKAAEVIAKSGLALAALQALEADASGSSFPEQASFKSEVLNRLRAKAARVEEKHGKIS